MDKVRSFLFENHNGYGAPPDTLDKIQHTIKYKVEPFFEYTLNILGVCIVVGGAVASLVTGFRDAQKKKSWDVIASRMRVHMSQAITLALTFILGAEVMKTFRVTNMYQVLKVTALVILRQLITYFLDKDVERLKSESTD